METVGLHPVFIENFLLLQRLFNTSLFRFETKIISDDIITKNIDCNQIYNNILQNKKIISENIETDNQKVNNLKVKDANIDFLDVEDQKVNNLKVKNANIDFLEADDQRVNNLKVKNANIDFLDVEDQKVNNLKIKNANIDFLDVEDQKVNNLKVKYGEINSLDSILLKSKNIISENIKGDIIEGHEINVVSDRRLKKNISYNSVSSDYLDKIDLATFEYLNSDKSHIGFIAQDIYKYYPQLINEDINGNYSIKYLELIPLLLDYNKKIKIRLSNLEEKLTF